MSKRYTITAALPYTNGPIHIGHLAGVYVPADIYARFKRLTDNDVLFICGSDEHGVPITIKAKKEGITPQDVVDKYHAIIKTSFEDFGITFDNYSRTSAQIHHETASEFFKTLYDKHEFVEEVTEQLYDEEANQFLADRFVTGTCPKCGHEEAYGDQCENCGSSLSATELINPKSAITGNVPTLKETKHWFLPLNKHENFLREWILEGHKKDWKPNVYGQVKSWIDDGLRPRAVTRDLDWGIPVPVPGGEGKVLYVWFDAPIGYISATKEWANREGKDWTPYWKDKDTKLLHFIGKDNIVFHCIIFPSMLKAEGSYILPDNVPANEFLNLEGKKLSTSKNWAVWLPEYLEDFPGQQDVLRYVLTANAPESKDNDFTWKDFQARNNNELVAIFGNFINRVVVLTNKYYNGVVPKASEFSAVDEETLAAVRAYPDVIASSIERYRFREASQELMNLARLGNKYLADEEPWKLVKTDEARTKTIMYVALQIASALATLSEPFLPFTSEKLKRILDITGATWRAVKTQDELIESGHQIGKGELLFSKIEDKTIQAQLNKLEASKKANEAANATVEPQKDTITFEDFTKLDIRVGKILEAEKMPKTKKLLVLKVDTGIDTRTIVSGIAESFTPEEVIGKQVTVLVNLAPRALRGVESEGMILMTETPEGKLVFVNPDQAVKNGLQIS
ncbi:methionine--tRNA ligase [Psychroserpens sp.]|uniref:methionine--tRNA ligase n=1 Tax=Psychroserpens sp. TaxID=2020870 RepID=UPI001B115518|nr:methionine--tRNA ligase [Psychroserpens sp.]MBO6605519.1 methionine--tRNA ligase [Psychroserpens sp.]MBO6630198.1 methionine--tRNA ligase [Psychroserpens sp.]MBO6653672.1 methionine--tRNA ligase [Psychroserpens sp.]MBO6681993.1 methionine--tRNA ligase [Psychroserpens sp.]MBO6748893.1 methionine--tRNA ligase [Psychroserpens sp.]